MSRFKSRRPSGINRRPADDDVEALAVGCVALAVFVCFLLWTGFVGWALYTVISWLVTK